MSGSGRLIHGLRKLLPLLGIALFTLSIFILVRELNRYTLSDIASKLGTIPLSSFLLAAFFTFLTYLNLTLFDLLASRRVGVRLSYGKVATVAFIGYAFSKNIGVTFLSGTSVRLRLYGKWKIQPGKIFAIVVLGYATFWLGFLALSGTVFILWPPFLQGRVNLPFDSIKVIGTIALVLYGTYLLLISFRKKPVRFGKLKFSLPDRTFTLVQTGVSVIDWLLSATVLYFLMPEGTFYFKVLAVFLLSQFVGLSSQVPGGIGVFEALTLTILSPALGADTLIASLIVYRFVFYIVPFILAMVLLALEEFLWGRSRGDGPFRSQIQRIDE